MHVHKHTQRHRDLCYRLLKAKRNSAGWKKTAKNQRGSVKQEEGPCLDGFLHVSSVLVRD